MGESERKKNRGYERKGRERVRGERKRKAQVQGDGGRDTGMKRGTRWEGTTARMEREKREQ